MTQLEHARKEYETWYAAWLNGNNDYLIPIWQKWAREVALLERIMSKVDIILEAVEQTGLLEDYQLSNLAEFLEGELRQKASKY